LRADAEHRHEQGGGVGFPVPRVETLGYFRGDPMGRLGHPFPCGRLSGFGLKMGLGGVYLRKEGGA